MGRQGQHGFIFMHRLRRLLLWLFHPLALGWRSLIIVVVLVDVLVNVLVGMVERPPKSLLV